MPIRERTSRARKRQAFLKELATEEVVTMAHAGGVSRAVEAVDALRRIQEGTYGWCSDCNLKIPSARLQAKPEAVRCVKCQTEYEYRTTHRRGDEDYDYRQSA
ncbi:MAG: TraR/DksA family transcriptional regulator [Phycisphaerae bacterium]